MTNLLYQEIVMDHQRDPRNFYSLPVEERVFLKKVFNPVCGDEVTVYLRKSIDSLKIQELCFQGKSCALCTASASMMTVELKGLDFEDALKKISEFRSILQGKNNQNFFEDSDLESLFNVMNYPARIKCVLLAWTALNDLLNEANHV